MQYEDATSKSLMMLPTDMALIWDKKFKPYVQQYAQDEELFFKVPPTTSCCGSCLPCLSITCLQLSEGQTHGMLQDFAAAFSKLMELGVPFPDAPAAA